MSKAPKIILTFKANERYMYDEIVKHSGKANWVKDILKNHIRPPNEKAPPQDTEAH
jgi:hypothetical protein